MTGRILTSSNYQRMRWKNGGGTTTEIWKAVSLDGETLWRLSIADVASDGPFSTFPGIDRFIMVIDGTGMELTVDGRQQRLADLFQPFAFSERIAFTAEQTARVFDTARSLGLPVKLHADQLSDQGGAALAARYGALSADHIEYSSEEGIAAMGKAGTVAVLLPGAFFFLREKKLPPLDALRKHSVPIAISTDCNPGSSPALSLLLMMNMAGTLFRMTPEETLAGVTKHAAAALGMGDTHGQLRAGYAADLAIWDIGRPAELSYWLGGNPCAGVLQAGRWRQKIKSVTA